MNTNIKQLYVKTGITPLASLMEDFTKQEISDKEGYDLWTTKA